MESTFLTDVTKMVSDQCREALQELKGMKLKPELSADEFRSKYGFGKRVAEQLKVKHGSAVVDSLLDKLGGDS